MAWVLSNPLANYIPTFFPGFPIANSLAVLLTLSLAMVVMTWVPYRFLFVLRVLLPTIFVFYYGPMFLLRFAYVTYDVQKLSSDRALYSLINLISSIIVFILSFGLILREAGLKSSTASPNIVITQPVSRLDAIYCSFVIWTTVGFGDIVPDTRKAKLVVMVEALFGYVTLGILVTVLPALAAGISEAYFRIEM